MGACTRVRIIRQKFPPRSYETRSKHELQSKAELPLGGSGRDFRKPTERSDAPIRIPNQGRRTDTGIAKLRRIAHIEALGAKLQREPLHDLEITEQTGIHIEHARSAYGIPSGVTE